MPPKKTKTTPQTPSRGRPTAYRPEYCERIILLMSEGLTFTGVAGEFGVTSKTLGNWRDSIPEFGEAADIGRAKCALFWERLNLKVCSGEVKGVAPANIIFTLKNVAGWRDKQEIEHKIQQIEVQFTDDWQAPEPG